MESALNPVETLLTDASRAGHTLLPHDVVLATCSRADVEAALESGSVIDVEWHGAPAWALSDLAESEEFLADGLAMLADENRLSVVVGPDPAGRRVALARSLDANTPSVVLDHAHRVGLIEALEVVENLPEDAVLVLALDNALPLAEVPGAVALDVASARICPVIVGDPERDSRGLGLARSAVSTGSWPVSKADDRTFVSVPVTSPDEALTRVAQLVTTSIPRTFEATGADIGVLTLDVDGPVGVEAVRVALAGLAPTTSVLSLRTALSGGATDGSADAHAGDAGLPQWRAVVVLLPAVVPSTLTRAVVYAALRTGIDHVSVVHGYGPDAAPLAKAIADTTDRPRRTRLAALLTDLDTN